MAFQQFRVAVGEIAHSQCVVCRAEFQYINKGSRRRIFCSKECKDHSSYREDTPVCATEGCDLHVDRRRSEGLCKRCRSRIRRRGTVDLPNQRRTAAEPYFDKGYRWVWLRSHPLAPKTKRGWVPEHRVVLFDKLGPNDQNCFWCDRRLTWRELRVDHLNERKDDNAPGNLVPSCNDCNFARGRMVPFIERLSDESFAALIAVFTDYRKQVQLKKLRGKI